MAIWCFCGHFGNFSGFGMLSPEKSGNPVGDPLEPEKKLFNVTRDLL
jgi:hypothetical protein